MLGCPMSYVLVQLLTDPITKLIQPMNLQHEIDRLLALPADAARNDALPVIDEFRAGLSRGEFRAAEKTASGWKTNIWVKRGILLAFKVGAVVDRTGCCQEFHFFDK